MSTYKDPGKYKNYDFDNSDDDDVSFHEGWEEFLLRDKETGTDESTNNNHYYSRELTNMDWRMTDEELEEAVKR